MQITSKKGFLTIVEMIVITIIIGLLAAMAIPAFHKVKINSIAKAVANGESVSDSQMEYLRNNRSQVPSDYARRIDFDKGTSIHIVPQSVKFDQTIVINGKTYGLVPINN